MFHNIFTKIVPFMR